MDENPYASPKYSSTQESSLDASMDDGERVLVQMAARTHSGKDRLFRFHHPVIGKLVITNRRVLFLSSGKGEGIGFVPESVMIERIAKSLDITALQRAGAWEFSVSEVVSAEASNRSLLRGTCLRVVGRGQDGTDVCHQVYRHGAEQGMWENIAALINTLQQGGSAVLESDGE